MSVSVYFIYLLLKPKIMNAIVLESAKGVKNGKVQLCFSQIVETGKTSTNILGLLNASDDRFNQSKPRYAWLTAEPTDVKKIFGIDVSTLGEGETLEIDMVDARMVGDSRALNIQITETTDGNTYEVANFEKSAKRAGKDGDFLMHDGKYIYVRTTVVAGAPQHKLFENTTRQASGNSSIIADALGE
jgi:hypothetical protein